MYSVIIGAVSLLPGRVYRLPESGPLPALGLQVNGRKLICIIFFRVIFFSSGMVVAATRDCSMFAPGRVGVIWPEYGVYLCLLSF